MQTRTENMVHTFQKLQDYCLQQNINVVQPGCSSQYCTPDMMMKGFSLMELDSMLRGEMADVEMTDRNDEDNELGDQEGDPDEEDLWAELE